MANKTKTGAGVVSEDRAAYGKGKRARRKIVIHTLEEMKKMDPPFPDETEWALELEAVVIFCGDHLRPLRGRGDSEGILPGVSAEYGLNPRLL